MSTVKFWGVQGSCPGTYHKKSLGSNTSCISIETNKTLIILDAGSGLRNLSSTLKLDDYDEVVLLLTHSHWDHIQGFPFFSYIYQKKSLIIYSHLEKHIDGLINQINGINFPLHKEQLPCTFKTITNLTELNQNVSFKVKTISTNHQGQCIGFRIIAKDLDVTYIPDNQLHNTTVTSFDDFVDFCKNTSLLIHDSQYNNNDMPHKIDWGHSIYTDALSLSLKSNAKAFTLFHHEPTREKKDILSMGDDCKKIAPSMNTIVAEEGLSIDLLGK